MIPWDLVYDFPLGIWSLLALFPMILAYIFLYYHRKNVLQNYTGDNSSRLTLLKRSPFIYWLKIVSLSLLWTAATLALMQPKGNGRYAKEEPSKQKREKRYRNHLISFLIDTSASMAIQDARGGKTRLESAKDVADQISAELTGQTASLYAFTSDTTKISPPSMDYFFLRIMLQQLQINEGDIPGTDISQALKALHTLLSSHDPSALKTLIIISDGGDTVLETLQNKERELFISQASDVFKNAEKMNLRIYTVGTGSTTSSSVPGISFKGRSVQSKLEGELLRQIAEKARGKYYQANNHSALDISRDLFLELSADDPYVEESLNSLASPRDSLIYTLYFQVPLGLAILLLAFILICPEGNVKKIFKNIGIVTIYLIALPLHAESDNLRDAALFFEAGDYTRAISLYEDKLKERMPPWQKGIISYNLATALLKKGDVGQALKILQGIPKDVTRFSLLQPYYEWNLGLSFYQRALEATSKSLESEEDYLFIISQLENANESIQKSVKAACALELLEGRNECIISKESKEILTSIRSSLFQLLQAYQDYRMHALEVEEKVRSLLASLSVLKEASQFMETFPDKSLLKESYRLLFSKDLKTWLPVWESFSSAKNLGIDQAKLLFEQALKAFEKNNFVNSLSLAKEAEELLEPLNKSNTQEQSFERVLSQLITAHKKILAQDSLVKSQLLLLQKQTKEAIQQNPTEALKQSLALIESALQSLNESKSIGARMYLEVSKRKLEHLNFTPTPSPQEILDEAIRDQKLAIDLNQLREHSEKDPELDALLQKAQEMVLKTALPYVEAVKIKQQELFSKRQQDRGIWRESLLSFNAGFQSAADAKHIQLENPEESLKKQQEAVWYWEKTKEKVEAPEAKEKIPEQASENKAEEFSSIEQTLQLLQEMQKDDQMPKNSQPVREVKRPW